MPASPTSYFLFINSTTYKCETNFECLHTAYRPNESCGAVQLCSFEWQ